VISQLRQEINQYRMKALEYDELKQNLEQLEQRFRQDVTQNVISFSNIFRLLKHSLSNQE